MLTCPKLLAVVNLLSDPLQSRAAANILAEEAKRRGCLVADLLAEKLAPARPTQPAAPAPAFSDVGEDDIETSTGRRIGAESYGLRSEIIAETDKAWLVRTPGRERTWLPKSQVRHHGEDAIGRTILIVPVWLARKAGLLS
jgi:hypothetical protein